MMPRTQNLFSFSKSAHAAYFMIEYQFSVYIIEVFAKKINFKALAHTQYRFCNLGYYPILAIFLKISVRQLGMAGGCNRYLGVGGMAGGHEESIGTNFRSHRST